MKAKTTRVKAIEKASNDVDNAAKILGELDNQIPPNEKLSVAVVSKEKTEISEKHSTEVVSVENLIQQAIVHNTPVDTMERLLAMRRELKAEYAKEEFDKAMANFQGECPTIKKTKAGGKTNSGSVAYWFAPLDVIVDQVKEPIQRNGFSYLVRTETKADGVKVTVIVKHKAGHSEPTDVEIPLGTKTGVMSASQVTASALTFAKRYAFCNAFGILTGDDDDDAEQTKNVPPQAQSTPKPQNFNNSGGNSAPIQPPVQSDWRKRKISPGQMGMLRGQLKALGKDEDWFRALIEEKTQGTIVGMENLNGGWASTFIDVFAKKLKNPELKKVEANVPSVDIDDRPTYQTDPSDESEEIATEEYHG